ncbi:hypothetical protein P3S68_028253 [Capsicum galapagoense]
MIRLKKEQEKKEQKREEKAKAHLYTIIKVARDEDLGKQIGKEIYFDLWIMIKCIVSVLRSRCHFLNSRRRLLKNLVYQCNFSVTGYGQSARTIHISLIVH